MCARISPVVGGGDRQAVFVAIAHVAIRVHSAAVGPGLAEAQLRARDVGERRLHGKQNSNVVWVVAHFIEVEGLVSHVDTSCQIEIKQACQGKWACPCRHPTNLG